MTSYRSATNERVIDVSVRSPLSTQHGPSFRSKQASGTHAGGTHTRGIIQQKVHHKQTYASVLDKSGARAGTVKICKYIWRWIRESFLVMLDKHNNHLQDQREVG